MKVQINFKIINPEFKQKYADEYNDGKKSENNWKYLKEKGYEVENVKSVELIENGIYQLKCKSDGEEFDFSIPDVTIFRCYLEDDLIENFAVSNSVLDKTHQAKSEKYKTLRFYFYIDQNSVGRFLGKNLFINEAEIPEKLLV
jgi:hypothetical protein